MSTSLKLSTQERVALAHTVSGPGSMRIAQWNLADSQPHKRLDLRDVGFF